jgi:hypothetical protein
LLALGQKRSHARLHLDLCETEQQQHLLECTLSTFSSLSVPIMYRIGYLITTEWMNKKKKKKCFSRSLNETDEEKGMWIAVYFIIQFNKWM